MPASSRTSSWTTFWRASGRRCCRSSSSTRRSRCARAREIAWAIRKNSPLLKAELNAFLAKYPEGSATRNMLFQKYLKSTKFVKNSASEEEMEKFQQMVEFFKKYRTSTTWTIC